MGFAVLHDHLSFIGGGERVALTLAAAFDADLYVTDFDPSLPRRAGMAEVRVHELASVPQRPPFRQDRQARAFREADLPPYDGYLFSGNWAVFAAPKCRPNAWYCHTPVRVFYDLREASLGSLSPWRRLAAERWIARRRPEYEAAVGATEHVIANSANVADRILRFLGRSSEVVHPPVDASRYRFESVGDFWLSVTRLSHEKRLGLLMDVFGQLPRERLIVVGGAPRGMRIERVIRSLAPPPNVEFLGEIDDGKLRGLYATCRGLVATAQAEDFGLGPVEAMASGKAVVAVDEGGYRESVVQGETGWLEPPTPEALAARISGATPDLLEGMRESCQARAQRFDTRLFVDRIRQLLKRWFAETHAT